MSKAPYSDDGDLSKKCCTNLSSLFLSLSIFWRKNTKKKKKQT